MALMHIPVPLAAQWHEIIQGQVKPANTDKNEVGYMIIDRCVRFRYL
jgi:hypothetical protein